MADEIVVRLTREEAEALDHEAGWYYDTRKDRREKMELSDFDEPSRTAMHKLRTALESTPAEGRCPNCRETYPLSDDPGDQWCPGDCGSKLISTPAKCPTCGASEPELEYVEEWRGKVGGWASLDAILGGVGPALDWYRCPDLFHDSPASEGEATETAPLLALVEQLRGQAEESYTYGRKEESLLEAADKLDTLLPDDGRGEGGGGEDG